MSVKEFLKKVLMSYFISVTGITIAIIIIGMKYYPEVRFTYQAFASPLIYGMAATLPAFIMYSKQELTVRKMILRKIGYLALLEISQLVIVQLSGVVTNMIVKVYIFIAVVGVYLFTAVSGYIIDRRTAINLNYELKRFQQEEVNIRL